MRGAKEWLRRRIERGRTYSETTDQVALTARVALDAAQAGPSSKRCVEEMMGLICPELLAARAGTSGGQARRTRPA